VIDLGTGSGAVALAIRRARPQARVLATDASAQALAVARGNARRLGLAIELAQGTGGRPCGPARFALAVCNPPYIAVGDPHLAALHHEPLAALTPGGDGLGALAEVIRGAPAHLLPGAWLLLEHGHDQAAAVQACCTPRGFEAVATRADLAGLPRCTGGRWTAAQ
jgi:release factor glutamine methyltransferase